MFGCGALHHIRAILKLLESDYDLKSKTISLICFEPIQEIWEDAEFQKICANLKNIYQSKDINLQFYNKLDRADISPNTYQLVCHPYYIRNLEMDWRHFQSELKNLQKESQKTDLQTQTGSSINESTKQTFSIAWTSNYLKNLSKFAKIPFLIPNSQDKSKMQPLIFIGAAPNLEDQIDWLKANRNNGFYLSSDTAVRSLLEFGLEPDGIITVDPSRGSFFHLIDRNNKIPIYTWLGAHRQAFEKNIETKIFLTTHPLDQMLGESLGLGDSMILRNPSLNLAGMAKALANYWNLPAMILAGWSLTSSGYKTHCRGSGYESYYLPRTNRKKTLENLYPHLVYKKNLTAKNKIAIDNMMGSDDFQIINLQERDQADQYIMELNKGQFTRSKIEPKIQLFNKPNIETWKLFISNSLIGVDSRKYRKFMSSLS